MAVGPSPSPGRALRYSQAAVREDGQLEEGGPGRPEPAGGGGDPPPSDPAGVTTHLPNGPAPKMDGAGARRSYPAIGAERRRPDE